ncbi:response regulator [Enterobacteriaceae bacterium RIT692]|nr:response regulator [Enterobacteriaceae bacterium RIT692]
MPSCWPKLQWIIIHQHREKGSVSISVITDASRIYPQITVRNYDCYSLRDVKMREKVVIFDSNPVIISGMRFCLSQHGFDVAATTTVPEELFRIILFVKPDFVIIDPVLMKEEYISRLGQLTSILKGLRIVIFASSDSAFHILRTHRLNWMVYLSKNQPLEKLIHTLNFPPKYNLVVIDNEVSESLQDASATAILRHLTGREMQVLREIGAGKANKTIAEEMQLSNKTISTYKRSIMQKLNTTDLRVVIDFARRNGF